MIFDYFERLFEVKRTKQTPLRIFLTFIAYILVGSSLFMMLNYQSNRYTRYEIEHQMVFDAIKQYKELNGAYPLLAQVNWEKETALNNFFIADMNQSDTHFYYVDYEALMLEESLKYTYIFDLEFEKLYTSEPIGYGGNHWHAPNAR